MEFLCRTCLKINLTPCNIFESFKNGELISESLMELASVEIQKDDGFPNNICESCLQNLTLLHDFKLMIVDSNRKLLRGIHNPIIKNVTPIQSDTSKKIFPKEAIEDNGNEQEFLSCKGDDQNSPVDNTYLNCQVAENIQEGILEEKNRDAQANGAVEIIDLDLESPNHIRPNLTNGTCTTNNQMESSLSSCEKIDNSDCEIIESHLSPAQTCTNKKDSFCIVCNKDFENKEVFKDHLLVHNREYVCNVCHEIFTSMWRLKRHAIIHKEKSNPLNLCLCLVCGKTFKNNGYIKTHMLIHSREKRYKCKLCPSVYDAKCSLDIHMKKHEGHVQVII